MPKYRVYFRNGGSVGPIQAANEAEARRIAREQYSWAGNDPVTGKDTPVQRVGPDAEDVGSHTFVPQPHAPDKCVKCGLSKGHKGHARAHDGSLYR